MDPSSSSSSWGSCCCCCCRRLLLGRAEPVPLSSRSSSRSLEEELTAAARTPPAIISGAMYSGVPTLAVAAASTALARPKSITFRALSVEAAVEEDESASNAAAAALTTAFSGLRSRWQNPAPCIAATAEASCWKRRAASGSGMRRSGERWIRVSRSGPRMSSHWIFEVGVGDGFSE